MTKRQFVLVRLFAISLWLLRTRLVDGDGCNHVSPTCDFFLFTYRTPSISYSLQQTNFFDTLSLTSSVCFGGSHPSSSFTILDRTWDLSFSSSSCPLHLFLQTPTCTHSTPHARACSFIHPPRVMSLQHFHVAPFFHCNCSSCLRPSETSTPAFSFCIGCSFCCILRTLTRFPSCVLTAPSPFCRLYQLDHALALFVYLHFAFP